MTEDTLNKLDVLNGLFTQKDFEFLKENNNRQEEIEYKLKVANVKKRKIIENIRKINKQSEKIKRIDSNDLSNYVNEAERAIGSIDIIIKNLTNIFNEFNDIERQIVDLIIKKESNASINEEILVNSINSKIQSFKEEQEKLEKENELYYIYVERFLAEANGTTITSKDHKNKQKAIMNKKREENKLIYEVRDNLKLIVSEKNKKVYLPYTRNEILEFLNNFPEDYINAQDVIEQEFIVDISIFNKHPVLARFREAYSLSRHREMKSAIDSLKFAMDLMFRRDLNPAVIAAVKSESQLISYIECLQNNSLDKFEYFTITFDVSPI